MTKLTVVFGNFVIAPKKWYQSVQPPLSINHQFSNELIAVSRNIHSDRAKLSPRKTIWRKKKRLGRFCYWITSKWRHTHPRPRCHWSDVLCSVDRGHRPAKTFDLLLEALPPAETTAQWRTQWDQGRRRWRATRWVCLASCAGSASKQPVPAK